MREAGDARAGGQQKRKRGKGAAHLPGEHRSVVLASPLINPAIMPRIGIPLRLPPWPTISAPIAVPLYPRLPHRVEPFSPPPCTLSAHISGRTPP